MCQLKCGADHAPVFPAPPAVAKKPFSPAFKPTLGKRPNPPLPVVVLSPASPSKKICLKESIVPAPSTDGEPTPKAAEPISELTEVAPVEVVEAAVSPEELLRAAQANTILFIHSARSGDLATIKRLVEVGNHDVNEPYLGYSALHYAVFYNHLPVVEYLIEMGANVDAKNPAGITPLAWGVDRNHVELVGFLLECEADPSIANNEGVTPLHKVARDGNCAMVSALLSINTDDEEWTPVNARTALGYTPAYFAAFNGSLDVLKVLGEYGADFDLASKANVAPLHRAVTKAHTAVAKFLVGNGVNLNKKDNNGRTALHTAAFSNQLEVVQLLLEKGAVQSQDVSGRTPLDLAAIRKHQGVVDLLEKYQENPEDEADY